MKRSNEIEVNGHKVRVGGYLISIFEVTRNKKALNRLLSKAVTSSMMMNIAFALSHME